MYDCIYTWIFENRVDKKNELILLLGILEQWKIIQKPINQTPGSKLVVPSSISLNQNLKCRKF